MVVFIKKFIKAIIVSVIFFIFLRVDVSFAADTTIWTLNNYIYTETGIEKFHKEGYTGKNINIGNYERAKYDHRLLNGKVIDVFGSGYDTRSGNTHGSKTALILHSVLPDSNIYILNSYNMGEDQFLTQTVPLIKEKNILVTNGSKSFAHNKERNAAMKDLIDNYNHKSVISAGNFGEIGGFGGMDGMWRVGALNGLKVRDSYSGYGDEYGFMSYCVYYTPNFIDELYYDGYPAIESGTSFSSPLFAGMIGLVDDFFIENINRPLTNEEMKSFIEENTMQLTNKYGMFVLPSPGDIDIDKYNK